MRRIKSGFVSRSMEWLAYRTTVWTGSSWAFWAAASLTLAWLISGPFFRFSDTWQLVMNTVSSIVTFLMVFLLQRSQNKESLAIQLKLNELIASQHGASNRLINIEDLSEEEVYTLHDRYEKLARSLRRAGNLSGPVSIEKAGKKNGKDQGAEASGNAPLLEPEKVPPAPMS